MSCWENAISQYAALCVWLIHLVCFQGSTVRYHTPAAHSFLWFMGAGETAQWSRVLSVLIEDLGLVRSSYTRQLTTTFEFKRFAALFWPQRVQSSMWYMCIHTYIHTCRLLTRAHEIIKTCRQIFKKTRLWWTDILHLFIHSSVMEFSHFWGIMNRLLWRFVYKFKNIYVFNFSGT